MEPDPHCSRLDAEDLSNLFGVEILHIVQHEDQSILRWDCQNRSLQALTLLRLREMRFRGRPGVL